MMHRLLIVDDEIPLRTLFSIALESDDYTNEAAGGGEEALKLLARKAYDLVLLDLQMPDLSGLEVLRQMRERGDMTKVIIVSAYIPGSAVIRGVSLGVTSFLGKPMTIQFLRDSVQRALVDRPTTDLELAKRYASEMCFRKACRILEKHRDGLDRKTKAWLELFRSLSGKADASKLTELEKMSEKLVTFQY